MEADREVMMARRKWTKTKRKRFLKRTYNLTFLVSMFILTILLVIQVVPDAELPIFSSQEQEFIEEIAPYAQEIQSESGLYASISVAQAALESNWGTSTLAQKENNLYGIKGDKSDPIYVTEEYVNGDPIEIRAHFRSYPNYKASMNDHVRLFVYGTDWNSNLYRGVLEAETYTEAARALVASGYATDPAYAEKLINLIEEYELYQYDR